MIQGASGSEPARILPLLAWIAPVQAGVQSGPGNTFSYGADGGLINSTRLAAISCAAVLFTKFASNGGGEVRAGVSGAVGGLILGCSVDRWLLGLYG